MKSMSQDGASNFSNIEYVFLDRDGVLNRNFTDNQYIRHWDQFELLFGVEEAVARLNCSGRKAIVVTNQRGVALGLCSKADLEKLHQQLREHLAAHGAHLDAIYYCPHDDGQCGCRKPQTGMLEQAFRDFPGATASNSVMVGDSARDLEAGKGMGMRTVLIAVPTQPPKPDVGRAAALANTSAASLLDFVHRCLGAKQQ